MCKNNFAYLSSTDDFFFFLSGKISVSCKHGSQVTCTTRSVSNSMDTEVPNNPTYTRGKKMLRTFMFNWNHYSVFNIRDYYFATKMWTCFRRSSLNKVWQEDEKSQCCRIFSQQLLHDISLVVGRLRLLGEEIHRLKKWGGLKLRILKITCTHTRCVTPFTSFYSCTFPWHVEECCLCGWHRFKFLHHLNL